MQILAMIVHIRRKMANMEKHAVREGHAKARRTPAGFGHWLLPLVLARTSDEAIPALA